MAMFIFVLIFNVLVISMLVQLSLDMQNVVDGCIEKFCFGSLTFNKIKIITNVFTVHQNIIFGRNWQYFAEHA